MTTGSSAASPSCLPMPPTQRLPHFYWTKQTRLSWVTKVIPVVVFMLTSKSTSVSHGYGATRSPGFAKPLKRFSHPWYVAVILLWVNTTRFAQSAQASVARSRLTTLPGSCSTDPLALEVKSTAAILSLTVSRYSHAEGVRDVLKGNGFEGVIKGCSEGVGRRASGLEPRPR